MPGQKTPSRSSPLFPLSAELSGHFLESHAFGKTFEIARFAAGKLHIVLAWSTCSLIYRPVAVREQ
jgi:hypothetical protein